MDVYRHLIRKGQKVNLWRDRDPGEYALWGIASASVTEPPVCAYRTQKDAIQAWDDAHEEAPDRGLKKQYSVKFYDDTYAELQRQAKASGRTITGQLEFLIQQEELLG